MGTPARAAEVARLAALERYQIFDTPPEQEFDDLAWLAATVCQTQYAGIAFIGSDRIWVKAGVWLEHLMRESGMPADEIPREWFPGGCLERDRSITIIKDTLDDERCARGGHTEAGTGVRFLASTPVLAPGDQMVGLVFVADAEPGSLSLEQEVGLLAVSRQVSSLLELRRTLLGLEDQTARLAAVVDTATDAIVTIDESGIIESFNAAAESIFECRAGDVIGRNVGVLMPPETASEHDSYLRRYLETGEARVIGIGREVEAARSDGRHFPADLGLSEINLGGRRMFTAIIRDLTERKANESRIREATAQLKHVVHSFPVILFTADREGVVTLSEGRGLSGLGLEPGAAVGRPLGEVFKAAPEVLEKFEIALAGESVSVEVEGRGRTFEIWYSPIRDEGDEITGVIAAAADVTERKLLEEELAHRASYDALTGLPNRTLFSARASQAIRGLEGQDGAVALLFLDLDRFKEVNDQLGHSAGDLVLAEVAGRLEGSLRPSDTAARFGGDEFTILLSPTDDSAAVAVAERVIESVGIPFKANGSEVALSASVGIAMTSRPDCPVDELLRRADSALYSAKESGRGQYAIFEG